MINFCTLFDKNYLARGLALYHSLKATCPAFHLYVFAFDDECYKTLKQQDLDALTVISLKEFEDAELLMVKPTRSVAEYCWTCTPSTILYCIKTYNLSACTYVDSDMFFYSDPSVLINEMGENSVLITSHRYTKLYDQSKTSGIYCVQFICFKNTIDGMFVLNWWRNACLEWCYSYYEDGKFGDQKYLDSWPEKFKGVHVLEHEGGGIAPWNLQQYSFAVENNRHHVINKRSRQKFSLVFIHFHGLQFFTDQKVAFCPPLYELNKEVKASFFIPYVQSLIHIKNNLGETGFDPNGARKQSRSLVSQVFTYMKNFIQYLPNDYLALFKLNNFNLKKHIHLHKI